MERLAAIETKIEQQKNELSELTHNIKNATKTRSDLNTVENIGRKKMFGKVELTEQEYTDLTSLAKAGISSRGIIENLHRQLSELRSKYWQLNARINEIIKATRAFREAMKLASQKVKEFFTKIFQKAKEEKEERRLQKTRRTGGRDAR